MNVLEAIKGPGRRVISVFDGSIQIQLLRYRDGSLGIVRNGDLLGIWEVPERELCYNTFTRLSRRIGAWQQITVSLNKTTMHLADSLSNCQ